MITNSVLLAITAPGAPDHYGEATPGANVWTGVAPGYLTEQDQFAATGGTGNPGDRTLVQVTVFITQALAGAPPIETAGDDQEGSTVLIRDERTATAVERRFRVVNVANRAAGSVADNVRLELDDEQAA